MGSSLPPPVPFDLVASYARLRDGTAEVVLADPQLPALDPDTFAVLRTDHARVRAHVAVVGGESGRRLVIGCPRRRLTDGTWAIVVRTGTQRHRLGARLLVQDQRPLVLLWGAKGAPSRPPIPYARRHRPSWPGAMASKLRRFARR